MGKHDEEEQFARAIAAEESRRLRAAHRKQRSWFGLGVFGLVGWAFSIPMLALLGIGIWIDSATTSGYSWALMGVFVGAFLGALNAWVWVRAEQRKLEEDENE